MKVSAKSVDTRLGDSEMSMSMENKQPASLWRVILIGRNPGWTMVRILVLVSVCFLLRQFALLPIRVSGISMLPTYKEGTVNLVNRLAYKFGEPRHGDVVAIKMAGEHMMLLKRVVGLPGETVAFRRGKLFVNGQLIDEPYIKYPCYWEMAPREVGPQEYYVVGDNRSMSMVDHTQGIASRSKLVGKALL